MTTRDAQQARGDEEVAPSGHTPVSLDLFERVAWSVVWFGVVLAGIDSSGDWLLSPRSVWLSPLFIGVGLIGGGWLWLERGPVSMGRRATSIVVAFVAGFIPEAFETHARHHYTTDSAAFNQLAAQLVVKGHNPYVGSLDGVGKLLHPVSLFWTYTSDGGHIAQVSYPAGSFLASVPFEWLGFHHAVADWVDLGAWLLAAVLLVVLLPTRLKWLGPFFVLFGSFSEAFSNGGTDALFVPFLILAVWQWDSFGSPTASSWISRWMSPVALGLACTMKQSPWFAVPFLVIGVAIEARGRSEHAWRRAGLYVSMTAAVFVVVNLPFMVANYGAWYHGSMLPLLKPLVPDGGGLVALALHGLTGGAVLGWLSKAGMVAWIALIVAFVLWYPGLKRAWLFLLPIVLYIPPRSLASYFVDFVPAAFVAALSVNRAPRRVPHLARPWMAPVLLALPVTATVAMVIVAFTTVPLSIAVDGIRTSDQTQLLEHVVVSVHNTSGSPVRPVFMVDINGGHPDGFWNAHVRSGSFPILPGHTAVVDLTPRTFVWTPSRGSFWIVDAYSVRPNALSTSPLQRWQLGQL